MSDQQYGRYHVLEPLAKGGMAQVFKAKTQQGRVFTLKKILKDYSENAEFIRMFLEEAKLSLSMKHQNVVRVLDFGQLDGSYFLAMEYVFGRDVSAILKRCAETKLFIPLDVACEIILQCCFGLHYAHTLQDSFGQPLNIVHRDISPPNVLVGYNGEVKILDFGIAKAVSSTRREETRSGVLKGKFSYMSPEQASGKPIDAQSDVFSLGTVFYELLTSRNLFYRPDEMETLEQVRRANVPSIRKVRNDIPTDLEKIILKSLALKQKNRYSSAAEMSEDVRKFMYNHFPRSDARNLAHFLRKLFASDYEVRSPVAKSEGWQDILEVGGLDEELLLDQSDPGSENMQLRPLVKTQKIEWYDRILYDPKTRSVLGKNVFRLTTLILGFLAIFYGYEIFKRQQQESDFPVTAQDAASETDTTSTAPSNTPAVGSLLYWTQMAESYLEKGQQAEALRSYNRALDISPFDISLQIKKNFLLLSIGNIREACDWFKKTVTMPVEDRLLSEGLCLEIAGQNTKALTLYNDFILKFPDDIRAERVQKIIAALKNRSE